jgi:hypothetical protein
MFSSGAALKNIAYESEDHQLQSANVGLGSVEVQHNTFQATAAFKYAAALNNAA